MNQHAIPQNILDIEFKLFTRFTVKEFVYMSIGVTVGGIFIYFWTENQLDWFMAFPAAAFFGGLGLFLGLVPINDQPADEFLKNYFNAINKPTQRVWQNKDFKDKIDLIVKENMGNLDKIEIDTEKRAISFKKEKKIIGGLEESLEEDLNPLDTEEKAKLKNIDILFEETGLMPTQKQQVIETIVEEKKDSSGNIPMQQTLDNIIITEENIKQYIMKDLKMDLFGTINLILKNSNEQAVPGATVIIKDDFDKPILALKSGEQGEVLSTKILPKGNYRISILHNKIRFPKIRFAVEKDMYPLIKIKSI